MPGCSHTLDEVLSQPRVWRASLALVGRASDLLAAPAERVLFIGCGTSAFMAMALAELREQAGLGESHWAYASELPVGRHYDRVVAITRSGTTTEILEALEVLRPASKRSVAICATSGTPVADLADDVLLLDMADELSIVQTRFPSTVLFLARAAFGENVSELPASCEAAFDTPLPPVADYDHYVFLGRGWSVGLAHEAALKIREAAQAWAESYPALDYRHGPLAVAGDRSLVWLFAAAPPGLREDIEAVDATFYNRDDDPLVQLAQAQRLALALAAHRGLDPDSPRHLNRSVVLSYPFRQPTT
jgi:glutamine---fructose-6-phosphate transaminase (isomerizing)